MGIRYVTPSPLYGIDMEYLSMCDNGICMYVHVHAPVHVHACTMYMYMYWHAGHTCSTFMYVHINNYDIPVHFNSHAVYGNVTL